MKLVLINNMPTPYWVPAWNEVEKIPDNEFLVIFCTEREPNRKWNYPPMHFKHVFLKERFWKKKDGTTFVHNNPDVWGHLKKFDPDVVITGGFNPTMLYAFTYCLLNGKKHIPITDAWTRAEEHLTFIHSLVRKFVFRFSHAFLARSIKGKNYYESYGQDPESVFISHNAFLNEVPLRNPSFEERNYDLIFSGQFTERKNPIFFIRVAIELNKLRPGLKLLLLGEGPLKKKMLLLLGKAGIDFHFAGYVKQEQLKEYYENAKIFLFPTEFDPWGMVANEAFTYGTPVITTPDAGCADELVLDGVNGFILHLDQRIWIEKSLVLLNDVELWNKFSTNAKLEVSKFTHEKSARELIRSCEFALRIKKQ